MQTSLETIQKYKILSEALLSRHGKHWSADQIALRESLLEKLEGSGFPSRNSKDWKYINPQLFLRHDYSRANPPDFSIEDEKLELLLEHLASDAMVMVFINGHFSEKFSSLEKLAGLELYSLSDVMRDAKLGSIASKNLLNLKQFELSAGNSFSWLNGVLYEDGFLLEVSPNARIERPLVIVHFALATEDREWFSPFYRHFLTLGESSSIDLTLIYSGAPGVKSFSNVVTQIQQKASSRLNFHQIQEEASTSYHLSQCRNELEQFTTFNSLSVGLGSRQSRQELLVEIKGLQTDVRLDGICLAKSHQHQEFRTVMRHHQGRGNSHQLFKGIATDHSKIVFEGRIAIEPGAQNVNSSQLSKSLLLSSAAEIDTLPVLEIQADDVKATHGASIGQLDPEQIFYFQSRGIEQKNAEAMLTHGFVKDVLQIHQNLAEKTTPLNQGLGIWLSQLLDDKASKSELLT